LHGRFLASIVVTNRVSTGHDALARCRAPSLRHFEIGTTFAAQTDFTSDTLAGMNENPEPKGQWRSIVQMLIALAVIPLGGLCSFLGLGYGLGGWAGGEVAITVGLFIAGTGIVWLIILLTNPRS
jgi:hypothetical protein